MSETSHLDVNANIRRLYSRYNSNSWFMRFTLRSPGMTLYSGRESTDCSRHDLPEKLVILPAAPSASGRTKRLLLNHIFGERQNLRHELRRCNAQASFLRTLTGDYLFSAAALAEGDACGRGTVICNYKTT